MAGVRRVLLEGRPGIGKTTLARRLVDLLRDRGVAVGGFTTKEIRDSGRRVGFAVETTAGEWAMLAHVEVPGPPRVGKYGVDLGAFERVALPSLSAAAQVVVVDEIGKMELASAPFRDRLKELLDSDRDIVATIHVHRHAFTDALKAREDLRLIHVTEASRDRLPSELAAALTEPERRSS
jgi:nucleoside-triphosphatase